MIKIHVARSGVQAKGYQMNKKKPAKNEGFYQDVSRITLAGLSEIAADFQEFYEELAAKFHPALQDAADQELPEASDQLNAVIESTETATTMIMDALEEIQLEQAKIREALVKVNETKNLAKYKKNMIDEAAISVAGSEDKIMKIFEALSFQDLTGQRIKKIVTLVQSVEVKIHNILGALSEKAPEREEKPEVIVEDGKEEDELKGPQREGQGMDQSAIDALLADL